MPSAICYVEIPTPDPAAAARFYGEVFGWTAEKSELSDEPYWMFRAGEGGLMGGFTAGEPVREGGVRLYLEVSDIPAALESVRQAGGTVVSGREAVGGDYGYVGVFRDPSGNTVGVWAQK